MADPRPAPCDILVIGGGINGAGVARDAAGRVTASRTVGGVGTGTATYRYDAAGQLVAATVRDLDPFTPSKQAWAYDATGNPTSATSNGVTTRYRYDAGQRLTSATTGRAGGG